MAHEEHEQRASGIVVRFAVLTLSDTRTVATDTSGRTAREMVEAAGHVIAEHALIRDDVDALREILNRWLADDSIDAVVTNGGSGIAPRDQTIPTIESYLDASLPGFGELFRSLSFDEIGPAAMLSRATAGISHGKFLAALPGSTPAITLALARLILPQIKHIIAELRR